MVPALVVLVGVVLMMVPQAVICETAGVCMTIWACHRAAEIVNRWNHSAASYCALKNHGKEKNGPIWAPVTVNGKHHMWFAVDCGASSSVISERAANALGLQGKSEMTVELGNRDKRTGRRTDKVRLEMGKMKHQTTLVVLPQVTHDYVLGREDMFALGIRVEGIPMSHVQEKPEEEVDFREPYETEWSNTWRAKEADFIEAAIRELWLENKALPDTNKVRTPGADVEIPTKGNERAYTVQYPLNPKARAELDKAIEEWIRDGVIEKCAPNGWCSPLITVPKKDEHGNWTLRRPCADVRAVNNLMADVPNNLPRIQETIERVMQANIVSELDARRGYHQLLIREKDRDKLTFKWRGQHYRFCAAPFGVKHLPYHFQMVMEVILADCSPFVCVYLDNIYVVSDSAEEHVEHLRMVMERINAAPLKLHCGKSHIGFEKAIVLGHEIGGKRRGQTRRPALTKVETFMEWPKPATGKQLRMALGFINYLRDSLPNYAAIAAPLERVRATKGPLQWNDEAEDAWKRLKEALTTAPMLHAIDYKLPIELATDASVRGLGAVLYNVHQGRPRYIRFAAKALKSHQREYSNTLRELLAILFGLSTFDELIYGVEFTVVTDHRALTFAFQTKEINKYVANWAYQLMRYSFQIKHVAGKELVVPDLLSRVAKATSVVSERPQETLMVIEAAQQNLSIDSKRQMIEDIHAFSHEAPEALRQRLQRMGHVGPKVNAIIEAVCAQCRQCQQFNVRRAGYQPLKAVEAKLPWQHLAVDLAAFEVSDDGYVFMLVVTCICTRFVMLRPLRDKRMVTIATELLDMFGTLGVPNIIQSDNGREFVNQLITQICDMLQIAQRLILPYNPKANSGAETYVRLSKNKVFKLAAGEMKHWDRFVPAAQLALNTRVCARHGSVPFELMYGRAMQWDATDVQDKPPMTEEELQRRFEELYTVVLPAINETTRAANARAAKKWAKKHRIVQGIPENTYVMIDNVGRKKKSDARYTGPLRVVRRTKAGSYVLANADGTLVKENVPQSQVWPIEDPVEPTYTVDKILDHRGTEANRQYLVRWQGFGKEADTWENVSQFDDVSTITAYWERRKGSAKEAKIRAKKKVTFA